MTASTVVSGLEHKPGAKTTGNEDGRTEARRKAEPVVDRIAVADVRRALARGLRDPRRAPTCGIVIGAFHALGGPVLYGPASWLGLFCLMCPLAAAFARSRRA